MRIINCLPRGQVCTVRKWSCGLLFFDAYDVDEFFELLDGALVRARFAVGSDGHERRGESVWRGGDVQCLDIIAPPAKNLGAAYQNAGAIAYGEHESVV